MLDQFNTTSTWQFDPSRKLPPIPPDQGLITIFNGRVFMPVTVKVPTSGDYFVEEDDFIEEDDDLHS